MQKVEWVAALSQARSKAMTTKNIQSGFRSAAIHPFNPSKFLRLHSQASSSPIAPPDDGTTPLVTTPLSTIADQNRAFVQEHPGLKTPVKQRLCATSAALETSQTENWLLRQEIVALRASTTVQKRPRGGISVRNLGTHVFSTATVFRHIKENEEATKARKLGFKRHRQSSSSPDPLGEDVFL